MTRIAIIGGGISGLAAAFALEEKRRAGAVDYTLYESSSTLGGVLRTEHIDGCIVEAGPDSFITEKPWAANLCRTLGLGDQLIGSNDADRKTYILVRGRLIPMPDGLMFMVPTKILPTGFSPLFSWNTKLRMAQELFHPPRPAGADESVASLVERHYGSEMVDRLADPLLSGVYGGEAASLSVRAVLPRFAEMERTHGSLGRAMLAARKKMPHSENKPAPPLFTSLKNGMQQLVETIVPRLNPSSLLTNAPVESIQRDTAGWIVSAGSKSALFDAVILAVPAGVAATLLLNCSPELSSELAAISYSSSITVGLAYDRKSANRSRLASDFSSPAVKANASWPQLSFTTNSRTELLPIALFYAASSPDQAPKISGNFPTMPSLLSSAPNCSRFSASAPRPFLPVSTNGKRLWRNTASAISTASTVSSASAGNSPVWRSPATPTAASAFPIASAPARTLRSKS